MTLDDDAPIWAKTIIDGLNRPFPWGSAHQSSGPDDVDVTPWRLHPAFHLRRHAGPQIADGREPGAVLVAQRQVEQQVLHGAQADARERGREARAHAPQARDRSLVERQRRARRHAPEPRRQSSRMPSISTAMETANAGTA